MQLRRMREEGEKELVFLKETNQEIDDAPGLLHLLQKMISEFDE